MEFSQSLLRTRHYTYCFFLSFFIQHLTKSGSDYRSSIILTDFEIGLHHTHEEKLQRFSSSLILNTLTLQDLKVMAHTHDRIFIKIVVTEGSTHRLMWSLSQLISWGSRCKRQNGATSCCNNALYWRKKTEGYTRLEEKMVGRCGLFFSRNWRWDNILATVSLMG